MRTIPICDALSDDQLRHELKHAASSHRAVTADLVALLAIYDRRQLHLDDGYNSLYTFCVEGLRFSESEAYLRIHAARAARAWPGILEGLDDGSLTLTTVDILAPHLTENNAKALLQQARHKRKSEVERLVASWHPRPDARTVVRPLSADRYRLQITIDQETHDDLRKAQDLLRHSIPNGDPALIVSRALKLLVAETLKRKAAVGVTPRATVGIGAGGRHIPAAVMREVWTRDGGRCAHKGPKGRCNSTSFVEFHHVIPFARGGKATTGNIELRCSDHNKYQARLDGLARKESSGANQV